MCVCTLVGTNMHMCMHAYMCAACVYVSMRFSVCASECVCDKSLNLVFLCLYMYICVCLFARVCMCMHMHLSLYT